MAQGPPQGFEDGLSSELGILIYLLLLMMGLVLAFAGHIVWRHLMSFIGAIIGGVFGFVIGTAVGGVLVGLIVSMLAAVVGSFVFIFLAEIGLGVVAGLFAYFVVYGMVGDVIVALVVAALALGLTVVFIEQALGIVTAIIGGLLVGLALIWLDWMDMTLIVVTMLGVMIFGSAVQLSAIKNKPATVMQARQGVAVPPMAPGAPGRTCPSCGGPLEYISEYNRFYCYRCQRYE
ncbi:MAG: hypothetical protein OEM29_07230 [Thermoplasmata archaeon]|nr:hypothetical protein [Thermoplasmata archaeon]